jgi:hypothetical protein
MSEFHKGQEVEVFRFGAWHKAKIVDALCHQDDSANDRYEIKFRGGRRITIDAELIRKRTYSYDPKCGELAAHFLDAITPDFLVEELAQHIQTSIEDWLSYEHKRIEVAKAKEHTL